MGGAVVVLPKKGTPGHANHPLLSGPNKLPEKCEFPKGADSTLVAKFEELGFSRADIVFGRADPVVAIVDEPEVVAPMEEDAVVCDSEERTVAASEATSSAAAPAASLEAGTAETSEAPAATNGVTPPDVSGPQADASVAGPTEPDAPASAVVVEARRPEKATEDISDGAGDRVVTPLPVLA